MGTGEGRKCVGSPPVCPAGASLEGQEHGRTIPLPAFRASVELQARRPQLYGFAITLVHSTLIPAALMIGHHFSISAF
jgi:hypothetical protein